MGEEAAPPQSPSAEPQLPPALVRALQERAARAQPAEHVEHVGDWWLRHTGGPSWWTGTVLAHGPVPQDELPARIQAAERFYDRFGATAAFQLTPAVCDPHLDAVLAERGYAASARLSLMTASAGEVAGRSRTHRVGLDDAPSPSWLATWHAVNDHGADAAAEEAMLARVGAPSAYATALEGGEVVGVGRAVLDDGWAGLFGMATLPDARRRGVGQRVLAALAGWAAERGAHGLYLQVEGGNAAALRLYTAAGFTPAARYHYRTRSR